MSKCRLSMSVFRTLDIPFVEALLGGLAFFVSNSAELLDVGFITEDILVVV